MRWMNYPLWFSPSPNKPRDRTTDRCSKHNNGDLLPILEFPDFLSQIGDYFSIGF
jgi:hypothetical protein